MPTEEIDPGAVESVFNGNLEHYTKDDLDGWRDLIHNHLLNSRPSGTEPITLLWIDDRAELERVFPSFPFGRHSDGDKIAKFVSEIRCTRKLKSGMTSERDGCLVRRPGSGEKLGSDTPRTARPARPTHSRGSLRNFPRRGKIDRMDRRPSRQGLSWEMDAHR